MEKLLNELPLSDGLRTLIGVGGIIVVTIIGAAVLHWVLYSVAVRITRRTSTSLDDRILMTGKGYFRLIVYLFGLSFLFDFLEIRFAALTGEKLFRIGDGIVFSLGVILFAVLIVRLISTVLRWYGDVVATRTETNLDDEFVPLADRAAKIVLVMLSLLIILDHFGVDIKGLITVLGVGSLAVALAAQDTLANMIGGFTIMIDRPFRKGDMVDLTDGRRVIVHDIGIRSTKFLTYDNTLIIVPNAELVKSTIHNITYPDPEVRVVIDVGVGYSSDMDLVERVLLEEAKAHPHTLDDPPPAYYFLDFGNSSLNISLRCYVNDVFSIYQTASELRRAILDRFRKEGIEIPFPQRVITMVGDQSLDSDKQD